jgi:hypothetical protein
MDGTIPDNDIYEMHLTSSDKIRLSTLFTGGAELSHSFRAATINIRYRRPPGFDPG